MPTSIFITIMVKINIFVDNNIVELISFHTAFLKTHYKLFKVTYLTCNSNIFRLTYLFLYHETFKLFTLSVIGVFAENGCVLIAKWDWGTVNISGFPDIDPNYGNATVFENAMNWYPDVSSIFYEFPIFFYLLPYLTRLWCELVVDSFITTDNSQVLFQ